MTARNLPLPLFCKVSSKGGGILNSKRSLIAVVSAPSESTFKNGTRGSVTTLTTWLQTSYKLYNRSMSQSILFGSKPEMLQHEVV